MRTLCLGLLFFLGPHAVRMMAEDWRRRQIERLGEKRWKGVVSLLSLLGLVLIVVGYGQARSDAGDLWAVPLWTRHVAALMTLPAFVLIAAAHVPGSRLKSRLGHPMLLGTALWSLAHLLANARWADLLLFGSFLIWSGPAFRAARQRDRRDRVGRAEELAGRDALTALSGLVAWVVFALWLHPMLIGVRPFG
jgi:uncharacterized membrane protein